MGSDGTLYVFKTTRDMGEPGLIFDERCFFSVVRVEPEVLRQEQGKEGVCVISMLLTGLDVMTSRRLDCAS